MVIITLFSPVGRFHHVGIYQLYYVPPPQRSECYYYYYHSYIQVELGYMGGTILSTPCTYITVYPNIIT